MKRALLLFVLIALPFIILANAIPNDLRERPRYASNIVKIQLSEEAYELANLPEGLYSESDRFSIEELDEIKESYGEAKILRAHIRIKDTAFEQRHGVHRWFLVKYTNPIDVQRALESFKQSSYIDLAIPEFYAYRAFIPNDTLYPNNWGHNNTAQLPYYTGGSHSGAGVGTIGFDSNAQAAWDDTQGMGSSSIIIAIIDTGVDTTHPDLRLTTGYDYGDNDANPNDDSADPGHGTACSGVAAGIGNNNLGVAGMAPGCTVMPLKIADSSGSLGFTSIENALYHCGDNNVDIASMSFGAEGGTAEGDIPSTDTALEYAYNHGVALFAATANSNASTIAYPSNHNKVISVGASSPTGQRKSTTSSDGENWWGSNYGVNTPNNPNAVDIMAPTILPATDIQGGGGYDSGNYSMWFNGTSCATPYAAGMGALLLSKNPTLSPAQLLNVITSTATDMTLDGGAGWDQYTGYGLVNAQAALAMLTPGMPTCDITSPANGATFDLGAIVTVEVTATDTAPGTINRVDFYLDGATVPTFTDYSSPYSWAWNTTGASGVNHSIRATAVDNENNAMSETINISLLETADEGFETGGFSAYNWVHSGNLSWTVQTTEKFSGLYAAKSGAIAHSQTSSLSIVLDVTEAGYISYYRKVSSESNYDFLKFYIDNIQQESLSGEVAWGVASFPVTTGSHEFRWTYSKDGSVVSGSDSAYLDHIVFPNIGVVNPPNITWDPVSITQELSTNQTGTQRIEIGNTGDNTLTYNIAMPTGTATVLDETFPSMTIPAGWTQTYDSGSNLDWVFATGGYNSHPATAYDGSYNARLYKNSTSASSTKLITPPLDLSGASSASLTFWHTQELWSPDQDELRVYFKTYEAGSWTLLATYTNSISAWTQETLTLPNPSATYYIGFQGTAKYGYGVCIDKVVVTKLGGQSVSWMNINGSSSASGSIEGGDPEDLITLNFDSTGLSNGTYNTSLTLTSNSAVNSTINIPVTLSVVNQVPQISVTPTSITFGVTSIVGIAGTTFSIHNPGTGTLSGTIAVPAPFTVLEPSPQSSQAQIAKTSITQQGQPERNLINFSVNPGANTSYGLSFAPTAVQTYSENLTITHNAAGGTTLIPVTGQGGKPTVVVNAQDFSANLAPGQTQTINLEIGNTGNLALNYTVAESGTISWLTLNGGSSVSNSIAVGGANQIINMAINTASMLVGNYTGTLVVTSNDPAAPSFNINIALTVRSPASYISPLGGELWQSGTTQNVIFDYSGAATSVILYYSINGGSNWTSLGSRAVTQGTNTYPWSIPWNSTSSNVKFRIRDGVSPNHSAISNVFSIVVPSISVSTTALNYGIVGINTSFSQSFTITNTGGGVLSGQITTPVGFSVSEAGRSATDNVLSSQNTYRNTLSYSINAGLTKEFLMTFSPTAIQSYSGNAVITHNTGFADRTIALSGTGGSSNIELSSIVMGFNLAPGQNNEQPLIISNSGNATLNYTLTESGSVAWLAINGTDNASGSISAGGANQSHSIQVNAAGLMVGSYSATILGTSNDPDMASFEIAISLIVRSPSTFVSPLGGEIWQTGTYQNVVWNYDGAASSVILYYSINGGANWTSLGTRAVSQGQNTYNWAIPYNAASSNVKFRIRDGVSPNHSTISNVFSIVAPAISVSTTALDFGTVILNGGASLSFSITNTGGGNLAGTITTPVGYSVSESGRDARNTLTYSISGGQTQLFTMTFLPTALQTYTGNAVITHNTGFADRTITLSGTGGLPEFSLSAYSWDLELAPGETANQALTLSNNGNTTLSYGFGIEGVVSWLDIEGNTEYSGILPNGQAPILINLNINAAGMSPGIYNALINGSTNDPDYTSFSINVNLTIRNPLYLISPQGGESWETDSQQDISWHYSGSGSQCSLEYSADNGQSWQSLGSVPVVNGQTINYPWTLPSQASDQYIVRVTDGVVPFVSVSSGMFSIYDPAPPSSPLNVSISKDPISGDITISWLEPAGNPDGYNVYLSNDVTFAPEHTTIYEVRSAGQTYIVINAANTEPYAFFRVTAIRD